MANVTSRNIAHGERVALSNRYKNARINLLVVALITLLNVILAAVASDTYFLFSAAIPFVLTLLAAIYCGIYPPEYYEGDLEGILFLPTQIFYIALTLSLAIIALYVLAFFLSNKGRGGWLVFALVLFSLDTLVMFAYYGLAAMWIADYLFHAWILVILALGVRAHFKLKCLPDEPIQPTQEQGEVQTEESVPLRIADMSVKNKVFAQATANGNNIVYRRVKRTNELVINGRVYDEYTALVEYPHTLLAVIDGHTYLAGTSAGSKIFISVDDEQLVTKRRWV